MSRSMRRFRLLALVVMGGALVVFSFLDIFDLVRDRLIPGGTLSFVFVFIIRILALLLMFRVGRKDYRHLRNLDGVSWR